MSTRNWFIKFNLDDMSADMDTLETDHEIAEWFKGFKRGARGVAPTDQTGPRLQGNLFGFKASQEADLYRKSRAENLKRRKEKKQASNNQQPASSIHIAQSYDDPHGTPYEAPYGATAPNPVSDRRPYDRMEAQYQTPKPEPVVLPFEETPEGKAVIARRAEIRARRLAKEQKSA